MKQAKVLNEAEIRHLLKVCELSRYAERNRLIVMFSFLCGMRACEIANLRVSNVVSEQDEVLDLIVLNAEQTKGSQRNTVVVSKQMKKEIAKFLAKYPHLLKHRDGFLLRTQKGSFNSQTIQNLFKHLYRVANIPQATSHSGRRTYISQLANNGIAVPIIQKLARHSSLSATQRYIEVDEGKLFNAVNTVSV